MPPSVQAALATDAYRARLQVVRDTTARAVGDGLVRVSLDQGRAGLDRSLQEWLAGAAELVSGSRLLAGEATAGYLAAYLGAVGVDAPPLPPVSPVDVSGDLLAGRKALLWALAHGAGREKATGYGRYVAERTSRTLIAAAARDVLAAGMKRSPRIVGWRRVTSGSTCQVCAGAAKETHGAHEPLDAHPACRCTAEPIIKNLPEVVTRTAPEVVTSTIPPSP